MMRSLNKYSEQQLSGLNGFSVQQQCMKSIAIAASEWTIKRELSKLKSIASTHKCYNLSALS